VLSGSDAAPEEPSFRPRTGEAAASSSTTDAVRATTSAAPAYRPASTWLSLTERVHGRELAESLQLVIEYDPQPPFDSGSPTKADASTLRLAFHLLLGGRPSSSHGCARE
jgi:hypothetical protein